MIQNLDWDLSIFYDSLEDPALQSDLEAVKQMPAKCDAILNANGTHTETLEKLIAYMSDAQNLISRLYGMLGMTLAVETTNTKALRLMNELSAEMVNVQLCDSKITRYVGSLDDLEECISESEILKQHAFMLQETAEKFHHLLPDAIEPWVLRFRLDGADAFSKLRNALTGTLTCEVNGKTLPLPAVRGMAYDPDPEVRKAAYEAELAAYTKVDTAMAYCLSCIKGDASTYAEAAGYPNVLTQQLNETRMDRETLDALLGAMREALPDFRRYLKKKAELLGHTNGLPFWDLFAPVGESNKKYSIDEAHDLLMEVFGRVHPDMARFMDHAFNNRWIDFLPKEGKEGGAFCAGFHALKQCRVLTNFTGSFSDVSTLAHELGHGWHDNCLLRVPVLMTEVPMPLAETASIFNETLLSGEVLATASDEDRFALLESSLMEATQTIVDIFSRFLFESAVFEARKTHIPTVDELKQMMLDAQEETYGDGLDPEHRHPYMWLCKSHYYNVGLHFYNFPYAFGQLFGLGIYKKYQEEGTSFMTKYDDLLSRCGSAPIADVAASVGIDVRSIDYWRSALDVYRARVDDFCALADQKMGK